MRFSALFRVLFVLALLLSAQRARAGGLEYAGQGAQALGRGGAVTAKPEDPMVLAHNPAGLAELRGQQLLINFNLALFDACVDPAGFYGWGTYLGGADSRLPDPETGELTLIPLATQDPSETDRYAAGERYYRDPLDTVCLDQNVTPVPQIAWTMRVTEDLGIGFGFIFPAVQPGGRWGGKYGVIDGKSGELRPAPTRYMMLSSANLGVFPNLGFGYRIMKELRIGAAFEYGLIAINNFTMAAAVGGTSPQNDIIAHVKGQDWFIPALTASVHVVPMENLDLVVAFRWQDQINAKGAVDLKTGVFDPAFEPYDNVGIKIDAIKQKMPWKLRAGIRYADRLAPRPSGTGSGESDIANGDTIHDALQDERWDVELDVEYQANSVNQEQEIHYRQGQVINFDPIGMDGMLAFTTFPTPEVPNTVIEKHWQDQVSVRAGGTYNILPGLFGLSAGAHWENRGVNPDYMQIDFWPVSRVGLHTGFTVRIANAVDFVFSYAHIFQEDIVVAAPDHLDRAAIDTERAMFGGKSQHIDKTAGSITGFGMVGSNGQYVLEEPSQGSPDGTARVNQVLSRTANGQPPMIINAGRYRSNFDILAVGLNVHF